MFLCVSPMGSTCVVDVLRVRRAWEAAAATAVLLLLLLLFLRPVARGGRQRDGALGNHRLLSLTPETPAGRICTRGGGDGG